MIHNNNKEKNCDAAYHGEHIMEYIGIIVGLLFYFTCEISR